MRKFLCLFLVSVVLLSACGSGSGNAAPPEATGAAEATSAAETTDAAGSSGTGGVQYSAPGVLPIVPKLGDVTLSMLVTQHPALIDWSTNSFIKWMEEQTNVKIEFQTVPLDGNEEKIGLLLAAGDLPDVLSVWIRDPQIQQFGVGEGLLMPLNDLLDANCTYINEIWDRYPGERGVMTMLDGNIYTMPNINECYHCTLSTKMWMNQEWLDKLGLKQPTTTDELYNVLVAFRDKDPNGNGKADEIPLASCAMDGWQSDGFRWLFNAFTYFEADVLYNNGTNLGFYPNGDTITVPYYDKEAMKDALKYANKLFSEGLWYEGSFTLRGEELTQLVENPDAPLIGSFPSGFIGIHSKQGGERYRMFRWLNPVKGPKGVQGVVHDHFLQGGGYFLSKNCRYPEIAVKWGDYLYSYDATVRAYLGVKDVGWRDAKPGEMGINGKPALYVPLIPWQEFEPQNDQIVQQMNSFRPSDFRLGEIYDESTDMFGELGIEKMLQVASEDYIKYAQTDKKMPPVKFTKEESDELMIMRTELINIIREYMTAFMRGDKSIDADYDNFLNQLKAQGMDTMIEYYQKAYDNQFKK